MSMRPFQGRCHTCGHDHDSEAVTLRDVMDIGRAAHEQQVAELRGEVERVRGVLRRVVDAYDRHQDNLSDSLGSDGLGIMSGRALRDEVEAARAELGEKT